MQFNATIKHDYQIKSHRVIKRIRILHKKN